jgi:hypothetical protein
MKATFGKTLAAFAALMLAAGAAYAVQPASDGVSTEAQQQDAPKDCKMKPEDPRCKDDRKG